MKICVFPNDPLRAYFEKGEIKTRYYNPENIFDEVHFITPTNNEIENEKITDVVGNAKLIIHPIGDLNLINYKKKARKIKEIISEIKPDVIRSYNPLIQGWLTTKIGKELKIPTVVSIHNNYDKDNRELFLQSKKYLKYLKFWYIEQFIESFSIKNADKIICAYRFLISYVKKHGGKNIDVVYNRVDLERFSSDIKSKFTFKKKCIIYVARLSPEKNQQCLIRAIKNLDVKLILVGKGPDYDDLVELSKKLGVFEKIIFIKSVPNEELSSIYNSADIFAAPIKQGGVSIPMIEAMACGIPVVSTEREEGEYEEMDEAITFCKNNPESFEKSIKKLIENPDLMNKLKDDGLRVVEKINGTLMERRERKIYEKILKIERDSIDKNE